MRTWIYGGVAVVGLGLYVAHVVKETKPIATAEGKAAIEAARLAIIDTLPPVCLSGNQCGRFLHEVSAQVDIAAVASGAIQEYVYQPPVRKWKFDPNIRDKETDVQSQYNIDHACMYFFGKKNVNNMLYTDWYTKPDALEIGQQQLDEEIQDAKQRLQTMDWQRSQRNVDASLAKDQKSPFRYYKNGAEWVKITKNEMEERISVLNQLKDECPKIFQSNQPITVSVSAEEKRAAEILVNRDELLRSEKIGKPIAQFGGDNALAFKIYNDAVSREKWQSYWEGIKETLTRDTKTAGNILFWVGVIVLAAIGEAVILAVTMLRGAALSEILFRPKEPLPPLPAPRTRPQSSPEVEGMS